MRGGNTPIRTPSSKTCRAARKSLWLGGVRPRFALLVLIVQALIIVWVADSEIARGIYVICYSLMMPTVLYLLAARALRRWIPFTDGELALGYIVLTATIPIVGFGGIRFVAAGAGYLQYFSDSQPDWAVYLPYLGRLPVLHDPDAIRSLYQGGPVPWRAWTVPVIFWSAYLTLLGGVWLCLAGIFRRVWIGQERLTFPITMLPLRMMDPRDDIFRSRLLWLGFAVPAILQSLLVIHDWAPVVPAVQLKAFDIKPLIFTDPPWSAMPDFVVGFQPLAIGLAYFVPCDVAFSCWFFSVLMKLTYVASALWGVEAADAGASRFPYKDEQAAGAWIAFALALMWGARARLREAATLIPADERRAARQLAWGALACSAMCAMMMIWVGAPLAVSVGTVLVYVLFVIAGARVRAEAGAQWTFAPLFWTPSRVAGALFGHGGLSGQAAAAAGHFDLVHVDIRAQSLPYLMEGLNIAERQGIPWRTVLIWVGVGTVSALGFGWWATISKMHGLGVSTAKADQYMMRKALTVFREMTRAAGSGQGRDWQGIGALLFGGGLTMALARVRAMGIWGFHPVGYVLCNTLTMRAFVVPFFLAWLAKTLVLRLGGNQVYRHSVPFFVGVVLGDIVIQAFWSFVGWVFNVPIYQFLT